MKHIKHEYLRSRASRCLSLSSPSGDRYSNLTTIEILVLISWILHPGILCLRYVFRIWISNFYFGSPCSRNCVCHSIFHAIKCLWNENVLECIHCNLTARHILPFGTWKYWHGEKSSKIKITTFLWSTTYGLFCRLWLGCPKSG